MAAVIAPPPATPLRILIVEDFEADALLLVRRLKAEGYDLEWERVDDPSSMGKALRDKTWDVVLCDYNLPQFTALGALQVLREMGLDPPFIVVSRTVGEEKAVDLMKAGAHDIILKNNFSRLVPAIKREIAQARVREEHRKVVRALQENENLYRHLVESTRVIPGTFDIDSQSWTYVGPQAQEILGYSPGQCFKSGFWIPRIHPDDRDLVREQHRLRESEGRGSDLEYRMIAADGRTVWLRDTFRVVNHADGRRIAYVLAFDITETKLRDEQLAQAQKMEAVGQLTGGIAHDFNNLLAVIIGNVELARDVPELEPNVVAALDRIDQAATRAATLTQRLLAFSRRQVLRQTRIDLSVQIRGLEDLLRRTLGENIVIETDLASPVWPVLADEAQLESALLNLAINARDAMPNGGRLLVQTEDVHLDEEYAARDLGMAPGAYVVLAVTDTGSGMSPEVVQRIFEPFFTTKPIGKGTGLGLSMVYGFMKQSGGQAKVYSELGRGTTIRLYFPRMLSPREQDARREPAQHASLGGTETILIVEDDAQVRQTGTELLTKLGYRVLAAENGPAALRTLAQCGDSVHLLFTDVVLPGGIDGLNLAVMAKQSWPHLRTLYTSGYPRGVTADWLSGEQGAEWVSKPFRRADLAMKIRKVLEAQTPDLAARDPP